MTGHKIVIEVASAEDIPAIIELAHRIWHDHYPSIITTEQIDYMLSNGYTEDVISREMLSDGIIWLKAFSDGIMVGFAAFGPYGQGCMKLHKLYLETAMHGQGAGSLMLAFTENMAKTAGAEKIVLNVNKNNLKAIKSYQRNGFSIAESVVADIGNGFVMDDYLMEKQLLP